jgi:hypothetical protein
MAAAGAGQAGEDCRRPSPARLSDKEGIFAVENDALHLALGDVVVDGHGAVELASNPARWMPWNYKETLAAADI